MPFLRAKPVIRLLSQFKVDECFDWLSKTWEKYSLVDLCFPRNECFLLKAISISCRVYSPLQTVNVSCSISMRTNQGSLLPTSTKRARERDPGWVWSRMPQSKINPERGVLCISIFCLFFFLSPYYWSKLPFSPFAMITRATLQSWHYSYNSTKTMGKKTELFSLVLYKRVL